MRAWIRAGQAPVDCEGVQSRPKDITVSHASEHPFITSLNWRRPCTSIESRLSRGKRRSACMHVHACLLAAPPIATRLRLIGSTGAHAAVHVLVACDNLLYITRTQSVVCRGLQFPDDRKHRAHARHRCPVLQRCSKTLRRPSHDLNLASVHSVPVIPLRWRIVQSRGPMSVRAAEQVKRPGHSCHIASLRTCCARCTRTTGPLQVSPAKPGCGVTTSS